MSARDLELPAALDAGQHANRPLMSAELWAQCIGLPVGVVEAQLSRGYWPTVTVGKRLLVNAEAVRRAASDAGARFEFK